MECRINYPMEKHIHLQWSRETAEANGTNWIKPHLLASSHYLFFFLRFSFFFSLCFFSLSISVYSCFIDFSLSSSKHFLLICQHLSTFFYPIEKLFFFLSLASNEVRAWSQSCSSLSHLQVCNCVDESWQELMLSKWPLTPQVHDPKEQNELKGTEHGWHSKWKPFIL